MDIKGKAFKAVWFEGDSRLKCNNYYDKVIDSGSIGTILGPHNTSPEYINVKFNGGLELHFPIKVIIDQLQESPGYESSLFKEILKLIKETLCQKK
jgi:hypothetical protein